MKRWSTVHKGTPSSLGLLCSFYSLLPALRSPTHIGALQMDTRGGVAVTKFPTKYFRMELCVREWDGKWGGVRSVVSSPSGSGAEPRPPMHFGIFEVHRTLLVERTVTLPNDVQSPESDMYVHMKECVFVEICYENF